jgi:hypothetical protein
MAAASDARRVVILASGDPGYEFARKVYIQDPALGGYRFERGLATDPGFERAWRIRVETTELGARHGYWVDSTGNYMAT